jgi:hypothetical protein
VDPVSRIGRYELRTLDGRLVRTVQALGADTDMHDLRPTPEGNDPILAYVPRAPADLTEVGGPPDVTVHDAEIHHR